MTGPWPKLSESLPHRRELGVCQGCGASAALGEAVTLWLEHDERDRPTGTVISVCARCERQISPHPRLYDRLQTHQPVPGVMATCAGCRFADRLQCTHPDLKANGGPGLMVSVPPPLRALVRLKGGCVPMTTYTGPPACRGREEASRAD